jgi:hypothetical protein
MTAQNIWEKLLGLKREVADARTPALSGVLERDAIVSGK